MKVNISIDDVSPHPRSSVKVLDRCFSIINTFPEAKFSLFVPIAYWRTIKPGIATKAPLRIDAFPDFCKTLKDLPADNFEIGYHGLFHGIPGKSDNDEFQYLSYDQALEKIGLMEEIVASADLKGTFKKIFRPPAWRMSPHAIKALRECNFKLLALSPKDYALETYQGEQRKKADVVYYNCNPPFDPLKEFDKNEIVYHACEWDKNYLSEDLTKELIEFLKTGKEELKFSFLEDLL